MLRFSLFFLTIFNITLYAQTGSLSPVNGKTTGLFPYLEYGMGADRLGGAKMTYLDTGILVQVVDSTVMNYKIRLSGQHHAYLPKIHFQRTDSIRRQPWYLTGSWKVWGDDKADFVSVTLDEKLPYRSYQLLHPSRIVVEVFGATSNTNWITQLQSAREIKNVYHEQPEDDLFRIIIELRHNQHWGYQVAYEGKRLLIKVKRQPPVLSLSKMKIAVDAGHGGENNGARGKETGILEKEYNLLIAKELEKTLKAEKATVFMTREKDTSLSMNERLLALQKAEPDFLISIHLNSSSKDSIRGTSTYYRYIGYRPLTEHIQKAMLKTGLKEFGNIGSFNFTLSGPTEYPNCLVEVAFLSNKEDEKLIRSSVFRKKVARAITEGIKNWLNACRN